jgi:hypothetical protein
MRVVHHLKEGLADESRPIEPVETAWNVFQGIQTGADAYTRRIDRRLSQADRQRLRSADVEIGAPILELPAAIAQREPWLSHADVLAKCPEARGLLYGAIDDDYTFLVVLRADETPPAAVLAALEPFRPLLATRAEIARNPRRRWWECAWPRNRRDMDAPKVIALYRTDRGRFALDESGEWKPSIKSTILVGRAPDAPVAYLCGVLNSELLDLWYAVRGKTPWHVRRNYEPLRMNEMPYRRPEGDRRAEEVADLVRAIAANRRALLSLRASVRDLGRIVKDPWRSGPVAVDRPALIETLDVGDTTSVRLDPRLEVDVRSVPMGRARREGPQSVELKRGREVTAVIEGPADLLELLTEVVGSSVVHDVREIVLPKDLGAFARLEHDVASETTSLLAEGARLVEQVERLVCGLYDVPADLTEAVVDHARQRAARAQPPEPDD